MISLTNVYPCMNCQLSKMIQSGGFLGKMSGNMIGTLRKKVLIYVAVPLAKDVLPKLKT